MMAFALVAMIAAASCGQKKEAPKVLVLYYSQSDNTKAVAQEISTALGADLEEIVPVVPYNGTYDETIAQLQGGPVGSVIGRPQSGGDFAI